MCGFFINSEKIELHLKNKIKELTEKIKDLDSKIATLSNPEGSLDFKLIKKRI